MSEAERRRRYNGRVALIETARVLTPQFDHSVLYFTGSQIEILRNLMQYANRPDTFVSEYQGDYYLIPTDAEWDDVQAIVSDLEETLMGNPNTIWGYNDVLQTQYVYAGCGSGTNDVDTPAVPAGEVWRVTSITVFNLYYLVPTIVISALIESVSHYLRMVNNNPLQSPANVQCDLTLKEGDKIRGTFYGCTAMDTLYVQVAGYRMVVD